MDFKNNIVFEQEYDSILNGQIVRIANIECALEYEKEFKKRNKDIIMITEGIYQHFMLNDKANKFKKSMLNKAKLLKDELECVEFAIKQVEAI